MEKRASTGQLSQQDKDSSVAQLTQEKKMFNFPQQGQHQFYLPGTYEYQDFQLGIGNRNNYFQNFGLLMPSSREEQQKIPYSIPKFNSYNNNNQNQNQILENNIQFHPFQQLINPVALQPQITYQVASNQLVQPVYFQNAQQTFLEKPNIDLQDTQLLDNFKQSIINDKKCLPNLYETFTNQNAHLQNYSQGYTYIRQNEISQKVPILSTYLQENKEYKQTSFKQQKYKSLNQLDTNISQKSKERNNQSLRLTSKRLRRSTRNANLYQQQYFDMPYQEDQQSVESDQYIMSENDTTSETISEVSEQEIPRSKKRQKIDQGQQQNNIQSSLQQFQKSKKISGKDKDQKSTNHTSTRSKYRGVTRHKRSGRWEAHIWIKEEHRQVYLGGYVEEDQAAEAYDVAALKCKGFDVKTNFEKERYSDLFNCMDHVTLEEMIQAVRRQSKGFARGASQFRGVTYHPTGCWESRMGIPGYRHIYLGIYKDEKDAAIAYDRSMVRLKGPKSATNFGQSYYNYELIEHQLMCKVPIQKRFITDLNSIEEWIRNGYKNIDLQQQLSIHESSSTRDINSLVLQVAKDRSSTQIKEAKSKRTSRRKSKAQQQNLDY